ncbi:hypothetical protein V1498_06905 [Peribacillus sp. SCS-26]|uniref:hypothetical protein n=1 Tax=Paraperibacillus marinus TaxID=3115295 RepID=UPI0039057B37
MKDNQALKIVVDNSRKEEKVHLDHSIPEQLSRIIRGYANRPEVSNKNSSFHGKSFSATGTYYKSKEPDEIKSILEGIKALKAELISVKDTLQVIEQISPDKEEDNYMYELKEVIQKLDDTNVRIAKIETSLAVIEERSKKLDVLDKIQESINSLRQDIPQDRQNLASKDFVSKEISGAKLWIVITAIATGLTLIGTVATVIRVFM